MAKKILSIVFLALVIFSIPIYYALSQSMYVVLLPVVVKSIPTTAPPTPTTIPTPTFFPTPTNTPPAPPRDTGKITITYIFYDGYGQNEPDEFVEIRNDDSGPIQLYHWTLRDLANHIFTFPSYVIKPGEICRIYTNEYHPESCGFNYGFPSAIWNNTGDCAYLSDAAATPIDDYCY